MRKFVVALLTLCLISVVLPPTPVSPSGEEEISTCEYSCIDHIN